MKTDIPWKTEQYKIQHCTFNDAIEFQLCLATYIAETLNCILKEIQNFKVQKFNGGEEAVTSLYTILKKDKMVVRHLLGKTGSFALRIEESKMFIQ